MISFQNQVEIERPVAQVFSYLSDLENVPAWNYAIGETTKITPGPVEVGTIYKLRREIPSRSEEVLQVVEMRQNKRFAVEGELGPFQARLGYDFAPNGQSTRVTNDVELTATGPGRLVAALVGGQVRKAVANNLQELRSQLEK